MTGFTVSDALARLAQDKTVYAGLIEKQTYDIGIYRPDKVDPQKPHMRDEIYVVGSGRGDFICEGESRSFGPGDLLFVPAGVEHRS